MKSNLLLVNYIENYSLFSSKYLNYKDWLSIINIVSKKKEIMDEKKKEITFIINGMNNKRFIFNWDHLNNFYNLYK